MSPVAKHRHAIIEGRDLVNLSLEAVGLWVHIQIQPGEVVNFQALEEVAECYELAGLLMELSDAGLITFPDEALLKRKVDGEGFVYIITDGEHFKVGRTKQLSKRIVDLQVGNPRPLSVIWSQHVTNVVAIESQFHAELEQFKIAGEWFSCSKDNIDAAIAAVCRGEPL